MRPNLEFTKQLIPLLTNKGYPALLVEHEDGGGDKQDCVFVRFKDKEILSGIYVSVQLELGDLYAVALYERGHSGGDVVVSKEIDFNSDAIRENLEPVIVLVSSNGYLNR